MSTPFTTPVVYPYAYSVYFHILIKYAGLGTLGEKASMVLFSVSDVIIAAAAVFLFLFLLWLFLLLSFFFVVIFLFLIS